jgi:hypothetical protein
MALTKEEIIDKMEILEDGTIQVRKATVIKDDGVEISRTFHRHIVTPADDVSGEDARVQSVAGVLHTAQVKAAYQAKQNANENAPL